MRPSGGRTRALLGLLAKFVAVVLVAGCFGIGAGVGISMLTDRASTAEVTTTESTPLRVHIASAVLHPATTASGIRRRRARLGVSIVVRNLGTQAVSVPRPSLLAARQRIPTDSRADAAATHLGQIGAGRTVRVTLRFETAGAVTQQLTTRKQARVLVGRRSLRIFVIVGSPVRSASRVGASAAEESVLRSGSARY